METLTFRQPRIVALALLVVIAAGFSSLLSIGRQEDPTITNLFANVTTVFPGADPARVETLVTAEIEDVLREIPEVDVIESTSSTGVSVVSIELLETLEENRIEQVWSEIRDALGDAEAAFPPGVLEPDFNSDMAGAFAAIVAITSQNGEQPITIAGRYGDELADVLRNVPGTKLVELYGSPEEEVLVTVDAAEAVALGLTADEIARAIEAADAKVQAGRVRSGVNDFVLGVDGEITALDRIREVVVRQSSDGQVARLADIAEVTRGPRLPSAEMALNDGKDAILLAVRINEGLQVDTWMVRAKEALAEFRETLPASLTADLVFDQSTYTAERLTEVAANMAIGIALVIGVLFFTLGARSAMIVALILPLVSLASIATLNLMGIPIHQMSVTGLIVALGLLVDAAIVMSDEVGQRLRDGATRLAAVRTSVRRLFAPLLASTVTTALSFTPMIILPGPAGDFVGSIAIAVVVMLAWSFVMAITITPAIAGWALKAGNRPGLLGQGIEGGAIGRAFAASIRWSIRNPLRSVMLALVLPIMGFMSMTTLVPQFFPGVDRNQFHIEVELAPGTSIVETRRIAEGIDDVLRQDAEVSQTSWVIGRSAPGFYYNIVPTRDNAPDFAHGLVTTASADASARLVPYLQSTLNEAFPSARILVRGLIQGPPVNAPVELRIVGPDIETLRGLGDEAQRLAAELDMITVVRTGNGTAAPKVSFDVDEEKARLLGLDLANIARQLQASLEGVTGGSLVEGTEQLPVRVRYGDAVRGDLAAISSLPILPPNAAALSAAGTFPGIPLSALAEIRLEPSESAINRRNGERVNTVQAFLVPGVLPESALTALEADLSDAGLTIPAGYRLEFGGDADARDDTIGNLLAPMGLIVTLSIATIVLTFNSFRLSAVAFVVAGLSAGLSILALAIFQYPFGITAVIGVIGSIGVSINAAIIIMTGLQENRAAAAGDREAMANVVLGSSRHIVSTTVTTFGGFIPLILGGGGFWPPFAMSVAGGVLLSTVVSFYFTPPMFALLYRKRGEEAAATPYRFEDRSQGHLRIAAE